MKSPLRLSHILISISLAAGLLVLAALTALAYGSSGFGGLELWTTVWSGSMDETQRAILLQARVPRVAFAALVGAALGASGAVFQAVLRNPLADPYILGVSGGAALGGTLLMTLGAVTVAGIGVGVPMAAFAGALLALSLIFAVERWTPPGRSGTYVLLLTGVIFNAFAASAIMFMKSVVSAQKAQELLFYLMGSLAVEGTSVKTTMGAGAVIVASIMTLMWFARDLNIMTLGDDEAASLGVDVEKTRWITVSIASLGVAVAVAFSGIIGFVGLVVPHAVRLLVGPDHRLLLPMCALGGATFLIVADLMARSAFGLFSTTLPVGVLTSMIGAPLFMFFLWRSLTGGRS